MSDRFGRFGRRWLVLLIGLGVPSSILAQGDPEASARRVLTTTSLAAKEYAEGVIDGRVVNAPEVEEARLFIEEAQSAVGLLPDGARAAVQPLVDSLASLVAATADPTLVTAGAERVGMVLDEVFGGLEAPPPSLRAPSGRGAEIYATNCASCHGDAGRGDGGAAVGLDPAPSDFTDRELLIDQSPLDFFRKTGIGVAGTAMPGFESQLSEADRWAVSWYVTQFRASDSARNAGRSVIAGLCPSCDDPDVSGMAVLPPELADASVHATVTDEELVAELRRERGLDSAAAVQAVAYLRTLPFAEESRGEVADVLANVRAELARAMWRAREGDAGREAASTAVMDAYVAFEAVETDLILRASGFGASMEAEFGELRGRIERGDSPAALTDAYRQLVAHTYDAEDHLSSGASTAGLFTQSFILLIREGIEALLIIGALITVLARAGAGHRKREIWWGVGLAIVASLLTAVALETVFQLGVAQQEALEGITMLTATAVLIFVSYWLISKVEARRWQAYLQSQVNRALTSGSVFTLGLGAFLAVYREGFETVLFYKALFITAEGTGNAAIVFGAILATVALIGVYYAIIALGLRIPLRAFFAATSAFLLYMAFSFAGKGIAELQESSLVGITLLDWVPRLPWAGIYPTLQSLSLQAAVLALVLGGLAWTFLVQPRRLAAKS